MRKFFGLAVVLVVALFIGCGKGEVAQTPVPMGVDHPNYPDHFLRGEAFYLGDFTVKDGEVQGGVVAPRKPVNVDKILSNLKDFYDLPKYDGQDEEFDELWGVDKDGGLDAFSISFRSSFEATAKKDMTPRQVNLLREEIAPRYQWLAYQRYLAAGRSDDYSSYLGKFLKDTMETAHLVATKFQ
jgi:hypothetical protein